jgi:hypothetical protein
MEKLTYEEKLELTKEFMPEQYEALKKLEPTADELERRRNRFEENTRKFEAIMQGFKNLGW